MFAVLHIADFPLHAVLRTEPGSAGLPAALFDDTRKKSLVLAANSLARAAGVDRGMTAPQAVARCPRLLIRTPQPAAEAEARAALLALGFTLSPSLEDTAPGICTSDLRGVDTVLRVALASKAVTRLRDFGLPTTAGIARTPLLALYAARATADVLNVTDETHFLAPLPLAAADPSPSLAAIFKSWGLRTLGDFNALPRDEIVRRFGAEGLAFWMRATGGTERPLKLTTPPQTFSAHYEFEEAVETLDPLLFLLRRFLDRLTLELSAAQCVATELLLSLRLEDDTTYERAFRLPEPTGDVEILFRTLHTHLESLHTDAAIAVLDLRLTPARPLVRQQGLFETGLRDPHAFAETLARISALVGVENVGTPQLENSHRPDAVTLTPPCAVIPPPAEPPVHAPLGLPLRRFRPPLRATLELDNAKPTYLWTESFQGTISKVRGPWLSNGEWWQNDRAWARSEWDIALREGGLYRLVRIDGSYFVEGEYD